MKFHALLVVRDEGDVIEQSLDDLLSWADVVHIFDTGSTDLTWEIIQDFANRDSRVRTLGKDKVYFSDKRVRGWVFEHARTEMKRGDWFVRVDADEFYHIKPPEFVKSRLERNETVVFHQYYDFCLTSVETQAWECGLESLQDRQRPIAERRRWYRVSDYTEPRLCRYRESMRWPESASFPYNAGYRAIERLPIRHYPHRDPEQLRRRCLLRLAMRQDPENVSAVHWGIGNWRAHIIPSNDPGLRFWQKGAELPEFHWTNHLAPFPKRQLQRFAHWALLPFLDPLRSGYSEGVYPRRLPESLVRQLNEVL